MRKLYRNNKGIRALFIALSLLFAVGGLMSMPSARAATPLHIYWNPLTGEDGNTGDTLENAVKGLDQALAVAKNSGRDAVVIVLFGGPCVIKAVDDASSPEKETTVTLDGGEKQQLTFQRATTADGLEANYTDSIFQVVGETELVLKNLRLDNGTADCQPAIVLEDTNSSLSIAANVAATNAPMIRLAGPETLVAKAALVPYQQQDGSETPSALVLLNKDTWTPQAGELWLKSELSDDLWSQYRLAATLAGDKVLQSSTAAGKNGLVLYPALGTVYLDTASGNDEAVGTDNTTALKSMQAALTRLGQHTGAGTIVVTGTSALEISAGTSIDGLSRGATAAPKLQRAADMKAPVFQIQSKQALHLKNFQLVGDTEEEKDAIPWIAIKEGGRLVLEENLSTVKAPLVALESEQSLAMTQSLRSGKLTLLPALALRKNESALVTNNTPNAASLLDSFTLYTADADAWASNFVLQSSLDDRNNLELNERGYRIYFDPIHGKPATAENDGTSPQKALSNPLEAVTLAKAEQATILALNGPSKFSGSTVGPADNTKGLTLRRDKSYHGALFAVEARQNLSFRNIKLDPGLGENKTIITTGSLGTVTLEEGVSTEGQPVIALSSDGTIYSEELVGGSKFAIDTPFVQQGRVLVKNRETNKKNLLPYFALASGTDSYELRENADRDLGHYSNQKLVYISPGSGNDSNTGDTATAAVKSLGKALELAGTRAQIIVVGSAIQISGAVEIHLPDDAELRFTRYVGPDGTGFEGSIFEVLVGAKLSLENLSMDAGTVGAGGTKVIVALNQDAQLVLDNVRNIAANNGAISMDAQARPIELLSLPEGTLSDFAFGLRTTPIVDAGAQRQLVQNGNKLAHILDYFTPDPVLTTGKNEIFLKDSNLWIRQNLYYKGVMYLDPLGVKGDDNNYGDTPDTPVKTFARALEIIASMREDDLMPTEDAFGNKRTMLLCSSLYFDKDLPYDAALAGKEFTLKRHGSWDNAMFVEGSAIQGQLDLKNLDIDNAESTLPVIRLSPQKQRNIAIVDCNIQAGKGLVMDWGEIKGFFHGEHVDLKLERSVLETKHKYAIAPSLPNKGLSNFKLSIGEGVYIRPGDGPGDVGANQAAILLDGPAHDLVFTAKPPADARYRLEVNATWMDQAIPEYNRGNVLAYAPAGEALDTKNFTLLSSDYVLAAYEGNILMHEQGAVFVDPTHGSGSDSNPGTLERPFATAEKGLNAAKSASNTQYGAGLVYLLSPVRVSAPLSLDAGAGNSIRFLRLHHLMKDPTGASSNDPGNMFVVEGSGSLTLKNVSLDAYFFGSHTVNGPFVAPVYVKPQGKLNIEEGASIENSYARAVYVDGGSVTMTGGSLNNNVTAFSNHDPNLLQYGAAIYLTGGGSFTMTGGTLAHNGAQILEGRIGTEDVVVGDAARHKTDRGGALMIDNGTATLYGGSIEKNTALSRGGAVFLHRGKLEIFAGSITENACKSVSAYGSEQYGGGVYVNNGSSDGKNELLLYAGGNINGNVLDYNGGSSSGGNIRQMGAGVYVNGARSSFTMDGGSVANNTVSAHLDKNEGVLTHTANGGVYIGADASMELSGGEIAGNTVQFNKGGSTGTEKLEYQGEQVYIAGALQFRAGSILGVDESKYALYITEDGANRNDQGQMKLWAAANIKSKTGGTPLVYAVNTERAPIVLQELLTDEEGKRYTIYLSSAMGGKMLVDGVTNKVQASEQNFKLAPSLADFGLALELTDKDIWVRTKLVYLDGVHGHDGNDGTGPERGKAVKTFAKAKKILTDKKALSIVIVNTVTIEDNQTWSLNEASMPDWRPSVIRMDGFHEDMIQVGTDAKPDAALTLEDITLDGNRANAGVTGTVAIRLDENATFNIKDGALITKNFDYAICVQKNASVNFSGGTIHDANSGIFFKDQNPQAAKLYMTGGTISDCRGLAITSFKATAVDVQIIGNKPSITGNMGGIYLLGEKSTLLIKDSKAGSESRITGNRGMEIADRTLITLTGIQRFEVINSVIANNSCARGMDLINVQEVLLQNSTFQRNAAAAGGSSPAACHEIFIKNKDAQGKTSKMQILIDNCDIVESLAAGIVTEGVRSTAGVGLELSIQNSRLTNCGRAIDGPLLLKGVDMLSMKDNEITRDATLFPMGTGTHGIVIENSNKVRMQNNTVSGFLAQQGVGNDPSALSLKGVMDFTMEGGSIKKSTRGVNIADSGNYSFLSGEIADNMGTAGNGAGMQISGNAVRASLACTIARNQNQNASGGGVHIAGGAQVTIEEAALITQNETLSRSGVGAGVNVQGGSLILNGGTISKNKAANGAGVHITNSFFHPSTMTMNAGLIADNVAQIPESVSSGNALGNGGGIYVNHASTVVNITGGEIRGNIASDMPTYTDGNTGANGGGIYIYAGSVTMSGGSIKNNVARNESEILRSGSSNLANGGGVTLFANGKFTLLGGEIKDNESICSDPEKFAKRSIGVGGNIYIYGSASALSLRGGTVSGGVSSFSGSVVTSHAGGVEKAMEEGRGIEGQNVKSAGIHFASGTLNISENSCAIRDIIYLSNADGINSLQSVTIDGSLREDSRNKIYLYSASDTMGQLLVKPPATEGAVVTDVSQYIDFFRLVRNVDAVEPRTIEKHKNTLVLGQRVFLDGTKQVSGSGANPDEAFNSLEDEGVKKALNSGASIYVSGPVPVRAVVSVRSGSFLSSFKRYTGFDVSDKPYEAYLGDLFTVYDGAKIDFDAIEKNELAIEGGIVAGVEGSLLRIEDGGTVTLNGNLRLQGNEASAVREGAGIYQGGSLHLRGTPKIDDEIYLAKDKIIDLPEEALGSGAKLAKIDMADPYMGRVVAKYPDSTRALTELSKYGLVSNNLALNKFSLGSDKNTIILAGLKVKLDLSELDAVYAQFPVLGLSLQNTAADSQVFQTGHYTAQTKDQERVYYYIKSGDYRIDITLPVGYDYEISDIASESGRTSGAGKQLSFGDAQGEEYNMVTVTVKIIKDSTRIDWGHHTIQTSTP